MDKRTENHKEISSNKLKDIQALQDALGKSVSDKRDKTSKLNAEAEALKEANKKRHDENVEALTKEIDMLQ